MALSPKILYVAIIVISHLQLHVNTAKVKMAISHCNDLNGQIESFEKETFLSSTTITPCSTIKNQTDNCIGGITSVVHWLYEKEGFGFKGVPDNNTLILSSGNLIGGESGWVPSHANGWKNYGELIREHMKPHFMALGMKEFEAGLPQTILLFEERNKSSSSIGICNACGKADGYKDLEKEFCDLIESKFRTVELEGPHNNNTLYSVGIIGFITPNVEQLSLPGKLKFSDVVATIKQTTQASSVKTFIAIGDGSLDLAKQIIDSVPKVRLVIYGAGNQNTDINQYPLQHKNGFIATAGRYGSSVGKMVLEVETDTGILKVINATRAVTDRPAAWNDEAKNVSSPVNTVWLAAVKKQENILVGNSSIDLTGGEVCWRQECNLGNLMADAAVYCFLNKSSEPLSDPIYSLWHGGAFFDDTFKAGREITKFEIHKWLPRHNNVHLVSVNGSNLRKVFQKSATGINPGKAGEKDWGQFLQISSGIEISYKIECDVILPSEVRLEENGEFIHLQDHWVYFLAIPTFLYEGRGVYNFTSNFWKDVPISTAAVGFDDDCLAEYIKSLSNATVTNDPKKRISINEEPGQDATCKGTIFVSNLVLLVIVSLVA